MDDSDYEEERAVIMLELQGVFDPELLLLGQDSMKVLGLDTDEPAVQIGNCVFLGQYEDTVGTTVFFKSPTDEKPATLCCKTDKKLTLKRVFLEKKCQTFESSPVVHGLELETKPEVINVLQEVSPIEVEASAESCDNNQINAGISGDVIEHQEDVDQNIQSNGSNALIDVEVVDGTSQDRVLVYPTEPGQEEETAAGHQSPRSNKSSELKNPVVVREARGSDEVYFPVPYCVEVEKPERVESSSGTENATSSNDVKSSDVSNSVTPLVPPPPQDASIVDSASHLIRESTEFSLPTVCDSASGSAASRKNTSEHSFDLAGPSGIDSETPSSVPHISTSNSLNVSSRNNGDSEEEPMDIVVDDLNSDNGSAEALCMQPSESVEDEVTGSQDLCFDNDVHMETGSSVNSTVIEVGNLVFNRNINREHETESSSSFSTAQMAKDSADSTSNQVYHPGRHSRNYENYKSASGIDSTTNENNDDVLIAGNDSPINLTVASSSNNINDNIDSTLNNSSAEYVDFEMREARISASVEEADNHYDHRIPNRNHTIDSTSHVVVPSRRNGDNGASHFSDTMQPCEVSDSTATNQATLSFREANFAVADYDENSRVTESHIDDDIMVASPLEHELDLSMRPNDTVSESVHFEGSEAATVEETFNDAFDVQSPRQDPAHVTESCSSSHESAESHLETEQRQFAESSRQAGTSTFEFPSRSYSENSEELNNQVTASSEAQPKPFVRSADDSDSEDLVVDDAPYNDSNERLIHPHGFAGIIEGERRIILEIQPPEQDDNEVSESVASYSNAEESGYSEADALNQVSDSQDVVVSREHCASSSGQFSPRADGNIVYQVDAFPEANDNEVTESGTSNPRRTTTSESDVNDNDVVIIIPETSSPSSVIVLESCVSSNEQPDEDHPLYEMDDPAASGEVYGNDSRPSSSKEVTRSSSESVYDITDSPENDSPNDPCSSSSNKPTYSPNLQTRTSETEVVYDEEMSACCSTSDSHQNPSYREATALSESHHQNEDEVTESCTISDGPQTYEISESSMDNEGVLYIDTDSPDTGACISESCASSSNQYLSHAHYSHDQNNPSVQDDNDEVSESCHSFRQFSATESDVEESVENRPEDLSQSEGGMQCSVSDSTNICHAASHSASPGLDPVSEMQDDDNSSCEVSESHIQNSANSQDIFYQPCPRLNTSPSSSDGASTSQGVASSRHWKTITSTTTIQDLSSNDVRVSSASDLRTWSGNSIRVSSASDMSQQNNSDRYRDSANDDQPSASGHELPSEISGNEVADSYDENPADSTEDGDNETRRDEYDEQPEGSDNSKLPSSTSN